MIKIGDLLKEAENEDLMRLLRDVDYFAADFQDLAQEISEEANLMEDDVQSEDPKEIQKNLRPYIKSLRKYSKEMKAYADEASKLVSALKKL